MEKITLKELISAVKGTLVGGFSDLSAEIYGVDRDNREIHEGFVFFSLVGERFDAHDFLEGLVSSGVSGFVISKELEVYSSDKFYVIVEDTHKAVGDFAKWYKSRFSIPFVAVTGSVGKTTAKDMIASVLSSKFTVHKTQGNYNNTLGLPLTILDLNESHEICVLEMGMDTAGEIDYMANIVKPDIGVITNVGDAHIERLGSRENILKAKCELLSHISDEGFLFVNGDDPVLVDSGKGYSFTSKGVGKGKGLSYFAENVGSDGISIMSADLVTPKFSCKVEIPSLGEHMIYPTLFAMAVAEVYGLSEEEILRGISEFIPTKMRMNQVKLANSITILDDTYNANPQSMKAGISVLADLQSEKKIAVLGDMFELGDFSEELHRDVGKFVAEQKIDMLVTIGEQSKFIAESAMGEGMSEVFVYEDKESALSFLKDNVNSNTALLVKASRGMAMEMVVSGLKENLENS